MVGQILDGDDFKLGRLITEGETIRSIEFDPAFGPGDADMYLPECLVGPGLIDLQINGGWGHDVGSDPAGAADALIRFLPATGVTSFLPTLISAPFDQLLESLAKLSEIRLQQRPGARLLGIHLEGPFIQPDNRGIHSLAAIRRPTLDKGATLLAAGNSALRLITLAPELPGALNLASLVMAGGVNVAAGHSSATFEEANAGFDAGIKLVTHLMNAQAPLHHRAPGLVGAALLRDDVTVTLIADGIHVHPALCGIAFRAKGRRRIALISDGVSGLGVPAGRYPFGDQEIDCDASGARLAGTGTLAGSLLTLNRAVANMAEFCGLGLATAWRMASEVPAAAIGETELGVMRVGSKADLAVMSGAMEPRMTVVGGEVVFDHRIAE